MWQTLWLLSQLLWEACDANLSECAGWHKRCLARTPGPIVVAETLCCLSCSNSFVCKAAGLAFTACL